MEVSIYINSYHKGHLSKGTGSYGIVLEYIKADKTPHTKEIFDKFSPATKNKPAILACIKALEPIKKPCDIYLYINSRYITETINQKWFMNWDFEYWTNKGKPIPNSEEWQQLLKQMELHNINFIYEETTIYTSYIETMLRRMED